jgi:hypothetical protein
MAPFETMFFFTLSREWHLSFFMGEIRFMVYGARFVNHANGAAGQSKTAKKMSSTGIVIAISVG